MKSTTVNDVETVFFPTFREASSQGLLRVFELPLLPFAIKRVFTVCAGAGGLRGQHAHRRCNQVLACVSGQVSVLCDDSKHRLNFVLTPDSNCLLLPAGIWSSQRYETENSSLVVLCDLPFDEHDYIRNFEEFANWKMSECA